MRYISDTVRQVETLDKCFCATFSVEGINKICLKFERFEVFTAVTIKDAIFWNVAPCRSCVNRRFGGTYRLHLQGRKIRERGTSVCRWLQTADSLTNNDTLKVTTILRQIITELSEAVSEKDKIMIITKMVLNLLKQNGC
jgi:hypothetical protein